MGVLTMRLADEGVCKIKGRNYLVNPFEHAISYLKIRFKNLI